MSDIMSRGFRTGTAAAKEAAKSKSFNRIDFFKLSDGETTYVRFLNDAWELITVDMHNMVPTKPKPEDWEGDNWPKVTSVVCRNTKMGDGLPLFGDCYVESSGMRNPRDESKPFPTASRTWAVGVIREPVFGDGSEKMGGEAQKGKRVGFRDSTKEVDEIKDGKPTGKKIKVKEFVLFTMGWQNFFGAVEGAAQAYGTILDRDFQIIRDGEGLKTDYKVVGLDPTRGFDLRDPAVAAKYGITIDLNTLDADGNPKKTYPEDIDISKLVMDKADADYFARFIDPTKSSTNGKPAVVKPVTDASVDQLAAMAARISNIPVRPPVVEPFPPDEAYESAYPAEAINFEE